MSPFRPTEAVLLGVLVLCGVARAEAPDRVSEPSRDSDGLVTCEAWTALPRDALAAVVANPDWLTPGVLEVSHEPRGRCQAVRTVTEGLWRPLVYTALRCPTDQGWTETLLSSDDFDSYFAEWRLVPSDGGTQVSFQVRLDVRLPVPDVWVDNGLKSSAQDTVTLLLAAARGAP